jgi:hypothetical protein
MDMDHGSVCRLFFAYVLYRTRPEPGARLYLRQIVKKGQHAARTCVVYTYMCVCVLGADLLVVFLGVSRFSVRRAQRRQIGGGQRKNPLLFAD